MTVPADEGRHRPDGSLDWTESWTFDFIAVDASLAGLIQLTLEPRRQFAEYCAVLVGDGRPLLVVRDPEIDLPRRPGLEIRAEGLWADHICETPLEHWTIGLEAFAAAFDDPIESITTERGDRVALGFDLEWEAGAPPQDVTAGYRQPCRVSGDVLVGADRLTVDLNGFRDHTWGRPDRAGWARGRLADGTWFAVDGRLEAEVRHLAPVPGRYQAACLVQAAGGTRGAAWTVSPLDGSAAGSV